MKRVAELNWNTFRKKDLIDLTGISFGQLYCKKEWNTESYYERFGKFPKRFMQ